MSDSDSKPMTPDERDAMVRALMGGDTPPLTGLFALGEHLLERPDSIVLFLHNPEVIKAFDVAVAAMELRRTKPTIH